MNSMGLGLLLFQVLSWGQGSDWNALESAEETAAEARVQLIKVETLDLAELLPSKVLVVIGAESSLPDEDLREFVRDGGALLLFGESEPTLKFLQGYGIELVPPPMDHQSQFRGDPDFPQFENGLDEGLFFNMLPSKSKLTGNHPMALRLPPRDGVDCLLTYEGSSKACLVAHIQSGRGNVLVISDASVPISEMMTQHGNKQFFANALRRFCVKEPCEAILAGPSSVFEGTYVAISRPSSIQEAFVRLRAMVASTLNSPEKVGWLNTLALSLLGCLLLVRVRQDLAAGERVEEAEIQVLQMRQNTDRRKA